MFGLFKKNKKVIPNFSNIGVDMHSHILPGIDDGSPTIKESILMAREFVEMGFTKLIATPHVMADYYRNTPETIFKALDLLRKGFEQENIPLVLEAAAEYYLDESFEKKLYQKDLLTFGDNYLLFELSYINYPNSLKDTISKINDKGYQPILAHPERYPYFYNSIDSYYQVKEYGCYFQMNTISLTGYYGKYPQKIAESLVSNDLVDFIGSDMHHLKHAKVLNASLSLPLLEELLKNRRLYNSSL